MAPFNQVLTRRVSAAPGALASASGQCGGRIGEDQPQADASRVQRPDADAHEHHRLSYRPVDGVDVRVARSDGHRDETLILTCPWPESLYAFESTWSALSDQANLVAIDLPGFGGSARRDAWVGGRYRD
jgi:pimeloyl-ACP methyl ester carboxylesterase